MLAKTAPLLFLCACVGAPPLPGPSQPELAQVAQPYARDLQTAGITRLVAPGGGASVRLETLSGPVYIKYPAGVPSLAFELDIDPDGLHAFASAFDRGRDAPALDLLLPEAIRAAESNNAAMWVRNNVF